ncbi:protoporphyrinogen/coproporphyrinogen oxidase, partial [Candidatus Ruminimicrobium bovinum]|uniref:protoporphyrinogen/coproporphyrinogen oxidase n=1 Tax=Candidatus Ruminimicrobium bovinum TaxID=3242779 RepID=UPI0039B8BE90
KIYNDMPFIDWCNAMFGKGITKYFMAPYNQKLWNCNLKKMTAAWTAPFVPKPSVESIEKSAYQKNNNSYGYNSCFYYPQTGGCGIVAESLYKKVKKSVKTGLKVTKIDYIDKCVYADGIWYGYTNLISTQPLKELLKSIINLPKRIKKLTNNLKFTSVRCINLGIKYKKSIPEIIKGKHWIYIPNKKYPFYRVGVYSNVCPKSAPKNCYSLYVEFSGKNNVYDNCEDTIQYLKDLKIINSDDEIVTANVVDMPYAYVVFNKERQKTLEKINEFLIKNNIYSIGRYGGWEYSFIEKNISDAKKLAEFIGKKK